MNVNLGEESVQFSSTIFPTFVPASAGYCQEDFSLPSKNLGFDTGYNQKMLPCSQSVQQFASPTPPKAKFGYTDRPTHALRMEQDNRNQIYGYMSNEKLMQPLAITEQTVQSHPFSLKTDTEVTQQICDAHANMQTSSTVLTRLNLVHPNITPFASHNIFQDPSQRMFPMQSSCYAMPSASNSFYTERPTQFQSYPMGHVSGQKIPAMGRICDSLLGNTSISSTMTPRTPGLSSRMQSSVNPSYFAGYVRHHTTRASPITVQWLLQNYESADGVSLSRSALYSHYLSHCLEQWLEPMNPASFGKLIRSIFVGLRTRRLGTRGNSKYHYYGIRIKATSSLHQTHCETRNQTGHRRGNYTSSRVTASSQDRHTTSTSTITTTTNMLGHSKSTDSHRSLKTTSLPRMGHTSHAPIETHHSGRHSAFSSCSRSHTASADRSGYGARGPITDRKSTHETSWPLTFPSNVSLKTEEMKLNNLGQSVNPWYLSTNDNSIAAYASMGSDRLTTGFTMDTRPSGSFGEYNNKGYGSVSAVRRSESFGQISAQSGGEDNGSTARWNNCHDTNNSVCPNLTPKPLERGYFGSLTNQKFSLPKLDELCQMAGLTVLLKDPPNHDIKMEAFESDDPVGLGGCGNVANSSGASPSHVAEFVQMYNVHCASVYDLIVNLKLEELRMMWHQFWRPSEGMLDRTICNNITNAQLMSLCEDVNICQFVEFADRILYQTLLELIVTDSLQAMPSNLIHAIRILIKVMEPSLRSAIRQFNPRLINTKLTALSGFTKGLRRALGLTHLSQAVVTVIRDADRLKQMLHDITKLDLDSIQAQGSWASDCPPNLVHHLKNFNSILPDRTASSQLLGCSTVFNYLASDPCDLLSPWDTPMASIDPTGPPIITLSSGSSGGSVIPNPSLGATRSGNVPPSSTSNPGNTGCSNWTDENAASLNIDELHSDVCNLLNSRAQLNSWTEWLDQIVSRSLAKRMSGPKRASAARQLMLVWTYYSSLLMRELTLRSAASFSSCHLLRMLCDEYLSYRLEQLASSPLTTLPKLAEEEITEIVPNVDTCSSVIGLLEEPRLVDPDVDDSSQFNALDENYLDFIDSQMLSSGYGEAAAGHCVTPTKQAQCASYFTSKSPDSDLSKLATRSLSQHLDQPESYFSLGFQDDPLLTESNSLVSEKSIPLSEFTDNWLTHPEDNSVQQGSARMPVFPTLDKPDDALHLGEFPDEQLSNTDPEPMANRLKCEEEATTSIVFPKFTHMHYNSAADRTALQPRNCRKQPKHQLSRLHDYRGMNETSHWDWDPLQDTLKPERMDALDTPISSITGGDEEMTNLPHHLLQPQDNQPSRQFMRPFSGHMEKRVVAKLQDDVTRHSSPQTPRKTVRITMMADDRG